MAVLDDWERAAIPEPMRAVLGLLKKLTLTPADASRDDIDKVRAAGVSDGAIAEALYVLFCFNLIDRLADAFDFDLSDADGYRAAGRDLFRRGYGLGAIPGWP